MSLYRRWLIPFATMMLLWWLVAQVNHYLAPYGVYLFVGGLLVTYGALYLSLRHGLTASLLAGLAIDAVEPVPFGTHLLLFATVHVALYHLRSRVARDETIIRVVTALFANLALFLGLSLVTLPYQSGAETFWLRLFSDLCWSQLFVAAIAPWFFAFQRRALELGRVDMAEETRRPF